MWRSILTPVIRSRLSSRSLPLQIRDANGVLAELGPQPSVVLSINSRRGLWTLLSPSMGRLAQRYVEQDIDLEGELPEILRVGEQLGMRPSRSPLAWLRRLTGGRRHRRGPSGRAQIGYHYDVSDEFYRLWLDSRMVYSCAYFRSPEDTLEQAQAQKIDHICRKLRLRPDERLLDIGCGWGGLMFWAAEHYGARVTGITLSQNQHDHVARRIREHGLGDRCEVRLMDYRELPPAATFDKVVSVGMVEHVQVAQLPRYFATIERLLRPGGLLLNHGITVETYDRTHEAADLTRFMDRYVFPGSELCPIGRHLEEMRGAGLEAVDVESLRLHYAMTLHHWGQRLEAATDLAIGIAGEKKFRIWRIYMAGCAYGFERGWMSLFQTLCVKPLPDHSTGHALTRDYMYAGAPAGHTSTPN